MSSKKQISELKERNYNPTNVNGWTPDKDHRISTGMTPEGEMVYVADNKEIISDSDGFGALTGKDNIPKDKMHFGYDRNLNQKFSKIFNKEK